MAYVFKREGSKYWFAGFDIPLPNGDVRRVKKSTKKTKRGEAMAEATRLEELERKTSAVSGDVAAKAYSVLADAAASAAKGELSEARARELLAQISQASTGEALRFYTVRSWATDWLAVKKTTGKAATFRRYTTSIAAFLLWLAAKADGRLEAVTKADVRNFRDAIRKGWGGYPRSAATANFYAADVASMLRAAVRENLLLASPAAALEKLPEDDSTERETFTVAEVAKMVETAGGAEWQSAVFSPRRKAEVIEAMSSDWQGLILAGFYTGARIGDCARLTWSNVDLVKMSLEFMPAKSSRKKKRLQVPLHPRFASFLRGRFREGESTGPVFPALFSKGVGGKTGLSGQFGAIADAAGVDRRTLRETFRGKKGKVTQRAIHARTFHSLRHSLTTALASADVPEEIRRRITGHESKEVHQLYTHHERETLARALEKLPSI